MGSSFTPFTALCPLARHTDPNLVQVQPRKTHPYITERLLMGGKESNQTLEDLMVLKRSPDLLNNVKIGQDQLRLIMKHILFYGGYGHWQSK